MRGPTVIYGLPVRSRNKPFQMTYFLAILEVIINNQLCWMFIMKLLYFGLFKFSLNYMLFKESLQKQSSKILIS